MSIKLPYQQTEDRQFNQYQVQLSSALQPILANPASPASPLTGISIGTSQTAVSHGLDRQPLGWILTNINGPSTVWSNGMDTQFIYFQASAAVLVNLLVF